MLKNSNILYGDKNLEIPVKGNFGDFLLRKLVQYKDGVALINGETGEKLTYAQMAQEAMNLAVSLVRYGVKRGDVITILSENRQEYISTFIGIACAGATVNGANPLYTKEEIIHVLNLSKPKYVICSPTALKAHEDNLKCIDSIKTIILYGDERKPHTISYNDLVTPIGKADKDDVIQRLTADVKYEDLEVVDVMSESDVLVILYSSGTTGPMKGVLLTHHNFIVCCVGGPAEILGGLVLTTGPWNHVMGLVGSLYVISIHKAVIYLPRFDIEVYLSVIEKYKVTMLLLPPVVLVTIMKTIITYDLTSVLGIIVGSAPLHEDVMKAVLPRFPNVTGIFIGYGLTETTLTITKNSYTDKAVLNTESVGKILPFNVIKIVDEKQNPLGPNQRGEIYVKGNTIMKGYLGGDTSAAFDSEGFFKTGDVGYYDDQGRLFIVDRLKELIKYKGFQVPPIELETILLQHEAIKEAAVVGLKDPEADELPVAFVVLQPGKTATEKEIQEYIAERVSNPKRLRGGVHFIQEIPRNTIGKIMRKPLRELAESTKNKAA